MYNYLCSSHQIYSYVDLNIFSIIIFDTQHNVFKNYIGIFYDINKIILIINIFFILTLLSIIAYKFTYMKIS